MTATWIPCPCCGEFWCTRHGQHAFACPCPPIEEWETDPYAMPGTLTPPVARLLELVEADGRTRNEIAAAAGMSPAQLSHVLTGHRAAPSITSVGRILAALGKSWKDLEPEEKPRGKRRPRS